MKCCRALRWPLKWAVSNVVPRVEIDLLIACILSYVATKKQFDDTVAIHPTSAEGELRNVVNNGEDIDWIEFSLQNSLHSVNSRRSLCSGDDVMRVKSCLYIQIYLLRNETANYNLSLSTPRKPDKNEDSEMWTFQVSWLA